MTLRDRVFEVLDFAAGDPSVEGLGDGDAPSVAEFLQQYAGHVIWGDDDDLHAFPADALEPHCAAWLNDRGRQLEFEHYKLGVWQMIECIRHWLDGEIRSEEEIAASLRNLFRNCEVAAARLPDDDDEKFKIHAVSGLLQELGYGHRVRPLADDLSNLVPQ